MTDNNFKKTAQEVPAAPAYRKNRAPTPAPTTPIAPEGATTPPSGVPARGKAVAPTAPAQQRPVSSSSPAVVEMQSAIVGLVGAMQKNYLTKKTDPKQEEARGGTDPFGAFLTNQYINNAEVVGQQFVNVDVAEPLRSGDAQGAKANDSLRGVITTLGKVGFPGSESKPDGVWKTRTHNALKQAVGIASALLGLSKDMGVAVEGYTTADLKQLIDQVPPNFTDVKDKSAAAKVITPNLKKLAAFYTNFEATILNNEKFKSFITQEKPFTKHTKEIPLDADEDALLKGYSDTVIPTVNLKGKPVTLRDIGSPKAFEEFLVKHNLVKPNDTAAINKYMQHLKGLIDSPLGF